MHKPRKAASQELPPFPGPDLLTLLGTAKPKKKPRQQSKRAVAKMILHELYGKRIPPKEVLPDAVLLLEFHARLEKKNFGVKYKISDRTVLRAAGRRK